ncbi:MAG: FAD-dependent oxidoreductase [Chitinophagaceae bacterium]|nr:FAD-dependent oxidoreductase [Oligoflexus sp.]
MIYDQIIIGAGITGLTAARRCTQSQKSVIVLEKSRGIGGRVATRRFDFREGLADHGAIALELTDPTVRDAWQDILPQLSRQAAPATLTPPNTTLGGGMNSLPKALAEGLDIVKNHTTTRLHFENGLWHSQNDEGVRHSARNVIVTSPLPQAAPLFKNHPELAIEIENLAREVGYRPLWTAFVMAPSDFVNIESFRGYQEYSHPVIQSLCEQSAKGLDKSEGIYVLHTTAPFTQTHLEANAEAIGACLREALHDIAFDTSDVSLIPHRWRYAFAERPLGQKIWTSRAWPGLVLAGDFCLGSTIINAALSGLAASEILL